MGFGDEKYTHNLPIKGLEKDVDICMKSSLPTIKEIEKELSRDIDKKIASR